MRAPLVLRVLIALLMTATVQLLAKEAAAAAPPDSPLPAGAIARLGSLRSRHRGTQRLALSLDGTRLVSIGQGYLRLWDTATGKPLFSHSKDKPGVGPPVALSPDGKVITCYDYKSTNIVLLDAATGRVLREL